MATFPPSTGEPHGVRGFTALRLDPDDPRWHDFVARRPEATPFHHPAWTRTVAEAYGYEPLALALADDGGLLAGGLSLIEVRGFRSRRWLSLPFTDVCAPLASPDIATELLAALEAERRRAGISQVEIRAGVETSIAQPSQRGFLHTLALESNPNAVFARFRRSQVQQVVRKAERDGLVEIRRGGSESDLVETFYELHLRTRRRLGVPVQPRKFFRQIWRRLVEPGLAFVLLASADGVPVAGALFLAWNGFVVYKLAASEPSALRLRPNHLVLWEAIRWSCEHGFHTFDFGRTDLENEGLRRFKLGWAAEESSLVYSFLGAAPGAPNRRLEGTLGLVIRNSPSWVCRLAGEVLYRHAA